MAFDRFQLTNKKLDTVETGIEVVKEKVGIVDNRLIKMADDWRKYDSRLDHLEKDIHDQEYRMGKLRTRNDTHSAKLRALEEELAALKGQYRPERDLRSDKLKEPLPPYDSPRGTPRYDKHDIDRRNLEFQRDQQQISHRETYRDQMYGYDRENRYHGRHWERGVVDNTETGSERKMRLDMDKIDLHDGNFKPWTGRDVHLRQPYGPPTPFGGVYLFIRTNKDALIEVRKALQEARTVLANSGGQLKGIAHADQIKLLEGRPDGWNCRPSLTSDKDWDILNTISVFWFPTMTKAERWLHYESKFKIASFPEPDGSDVFAAPINFIPREGDIYGTTFLMTEYREILDAEKFRELFIAPMRGIFKRLQIPDFVMNTIGVKSFRGGWAKNRSIVTVNRFEDSASAERFFFDPEYVRLRTQLKDLTRGRTTVLFNLVDKVV